MRLWRVVCVFLLGGVAWGQDAPAVQRMAADADPSFEVVSIRPNAGAPYMLVNVRGRQYSAHNVAVSDLVKFAYRLHANEVTGLPDWATQERYDLAATMQPEGAPNGDQLRVMLKKLLAERFGLKAHTEQRTLPVYVMTVAKGGPKMKPAAGTGTSDVQHDAEGGVEMVNSGYTAKAYTEFLQQAIVDRAVIDRTGLTERYDFDVIFLPDNSMFGGRMHLPPNVPNAAPSLFTALEEMGLKLTPEKAPVDVLVVDAVARPTSN